MMVVTNTFTSRLQKIFITLGITAYVLQAAAYIEFYMSMGSQVWHVSQFTLMVADIVLLPVVLLLLFWWVTSRKTLGRERLFSAVVWTTTGLALQALIGLVYRVWLQRYIPYDGAHWYEPWAILLPSFAVLIVVITASYIARRTTLISLAAWRATAAFVVLGAFAYNSVFTLRDVLHQHVALQNSMYFAIGAFVLGSALLANYLLTTKESDSFSTRLYISTIYVMMAGFIFMIIGGVWMVIGRLGGQWTYAPIMHDVALFIGLVLYAGLLVWHKRQPVA